MPSILSSTAAPAPTANPGTKTITRSDEQDQNNPDRFGEALARSLEPAGEKIGNFPVKSATLAPTRRQAGNQKTDAQDLGNAMALSFIPFESRMAKAALPAGVDSAADSALPVTTSTLPTDPDNAVPGTTAALQTSAGGAVAKAGAALLNENLAGAPVSTSNATAAPEAISSAGTQSTLVAVLATARQNSASQTPSQVKSEPATDGAAAQIDTLAIAAQTEAANTGPADQFSKGDEKTAGRLRESGSARADLTPALPHSSGKTASNPAAPAPQADAPSVGVSPISADVNANINTTLLVTPVAAAMQAPLDISASNAPASLATASLAPEVGGKEWGKALGQHVVQMSTAGHQVAELQLNPPGLGPLKVMLNMNDHQVQAMFVSADSAVRTAVEAALPQLRTTLAESGISLGNTSVGAESQQQTTFSNGQGSQPERGAYRRSEMADNAPTLSARTVSEPVRSTGGMRIDTYA